MASPFTYPAWDLTSASALDPLPYKRTTFGRQVNNAGPWAGALPLTDEHVQKLAWEVGSRTGKTLLAVDLNGTLIWGGIILTRKYKKSEKNLLVGATEIGAYFRQRLQAADYTSTWAIATSPLVIVKKIMEDALALGSIGGGINIVTHSTGVVPGVIASYPASSLQTIDSITSTLSEMGYGAGFDYSFDVAYKPGTTQPEIVLNLWFPRQGRLYPESGLVLLDKDMLDWEYPEDSTPQANSVTEAGSSGPGIVPITASTTVAGYPLTEKTVSRTQIISEEILAEVALNDLALSVYPTVTPWIELPLPGPLEPGEFALGDDVLWRVDPVSSPSENTNPRFPEGMSFSWRIGGWTCVPADSGMSTMHLDLSPPPVSTIPPPQPPL